MKTENRKSTVNQNHSTNISMADRSVRYVLALTFSLLPVIVQDPVTYWLSPIIALWLISTALVGWDPIYAVVRSRIEQKNAVPNAATQASAGSTLFATFHRFAEAAFLLRADFFGAAAFSGF